MDKPEWLKEVNFNTELETKEFYENQRKYAQAIYIKTQIEKHPKIPKVSFQASIEKYFRWLDYYPVYVEENAKFMKEFTQKTGYKSPPSEDSNPDHSLASRMSGISSNYILELFSGYYFRCSGSFKETEEDRKYKRKQERDDYLYR